MKDTTVKQLNQLNSDFYKSVAVDFDDSRQYFWQGWEKIPPLLDTSKSIRVADIGCGNGRFGQFLLEKCPETKLSYTGIDSSKSLLDFATKKLQGKIPALHLKEVDIVQAIQKKEDFLKNETFQLITSFGVFHHIPSFEFRLELLTYLASKLSKDGYLIVSFWQFMNFERLRKKIISVEKDYASSSLDINFADLEKNDYILDWNRGATALRYCHFIDAAETLKLVELSKMKLVTSYLADGKEGSVNSYIVLQQ